MQLKFKLSELWPFKFGPAVQWNLGFYACIFGCMFGSMSAHAQFQNLRNSVLSAQSFIL